jgi:hypothetical protein
MAPTIGFHSVIERPESVSLVAPPTRIMATMSAESAASQSLSARAWRAGTGVAFTARMVVEDMEV